LGDKLGDKKEDKLGSKLGDKGDKTSEGGHTIQHRETRRETMGDKTSGRRMHHPTQARMWGDNGRQTETRPREGGHNIQHRHTCGETMGDKAS